MEKLFEPFIWSFRRGDDLSYNYKILRFLIEVRNKEANVLLNKPIVINIASIIECILYDFLERILQSSNGRHVPQMSPEEMNEIIQWSVSNPDLMQKVYFLNIIEKFKKHRVLGDGTDEIYNQLTEICNDRNRVHIQDQKKQYPKDNNQYWTTEKCNKYLTVLYNLFDHLIFYHNRWNDLDENTDLKCERSYIN